MGRRDKEMGIYVYLVGSILFLFIVMIHMGYLANMHLYKEMLHSVRSKNHYTIFILSFVPFALIPISIYIFFRDGLENIDDSSVEED